MFLDRSVIRATRNVCIIAANFWKPPLKTFCVLSFLLFLLLLFLASLLQEFDLEAEEYVPLPKGEVHKKKEVRRFLLGG